MKGFGQVAAALLVFVLAGVTWRAARLQSRVADVHEELALLQYGAPVDEYEDIEQSVGLVGRVPGLADALLNDVREHRAAAEYWDARYDALTLPRDTNGVVTEEDPAMLLFAANAALRTSQRDPADRQAVLKGLDNAIRDYADVMKKNPGDVDAAYNYEFVARLRDALSKIKPDKGKNDDALKKFVAAAAPTAAAAPAGDLPEGPTIHGHPGAPPASTDMKAFKMHIPVRGDERTQGADQGGGKAKVRKG
jgi:hypothetical protein